MSTDKKKVWVILGVCTVCLVVVSVEGKLRSLRNEMKYYVENKATQAIGHRVSIGSVKGGVFKELYVKRFAIKSDDGKGDLFYAGGMKINFKLWDILFPKKGLSRKLEVRLINPVLQGDFKSARIFAAASNIAGSWQGAFLARASHIHFEEGFRLYIQDGNISSPGGRLKIDNIYGTLDASRDDVKFDNLTGDLFGVPIEAKGRIAIVNEAAPQLEIRFSSDSAYVRGYLDVSGDIQKLKLNLFLHPATLTDIYANGYFSFEKKAVEFEEIYVGADAALRRNGDETIKPKIKLLCELSKLPAYTLILKLNHISIGGNDLLSDVVFDGTFFAGEAGDVIMEGEVANFNTILNYKPFPDSSVLYAIKRDAVEIKELKVGESVKLAGSAILKGSHALDMILELKNVDLEELFAYSVEDAPPVSGIVNGKLNIKGDLAKPFLNGRLEASNGRMGPLNYDALIFNLSGEFPVIHFNDSKMIKNDTALFLEGDMDLRRFGKSRVFENVRIKSDEKMIVWDGWDITKGKDEPKLSLGRDVGDSFHIDFNTFLEKDLDLAEEKPQGEVEFGYKVTDEGTFKVKLKGEERFLGVEHKKRF